MIRASIKPVEDDCCISEDGDKVCLGSLDLLNLRLNSPDLKRPSSSKFQNSVRESGDYNSYLPLRERSRHPLEKVEARLLIPNINNLPQGYGRVRSVQRIVSENFALLHTKEKEPEYVLTEPLEEEDFLFPIKKNPPSKKVVAECGRTSPSPSPAAKNIFDSFPFKYTPSGNIKVDTSQVVFSSNKLSVLVADPKNIKVQIKPELNFDKMGKDVIKLAGKSAIDTIMSQAGLSSIGSLLGHTPVRTEKEASEYESKQTDEILHPELNLGRLGYTNKDKISWSKIRLPEKTNLYMELYARITNYTNADCKVYIENEEFNCHLLVLQCYSELFDSYVAIKKVELSQDNCSSGSFAFIYDWMITGEPSYKKLTRENVLDIFKAAKYLKIKDLVEQCWAFIDNRDVFNEETAYFLYVESKHKKLPEVRELMLPRICTFFLILVSSQDWLEIEFDDVKTILSSNYICVNCEMEVFMASVRWLKHNWPSRDKYKHEIFECVRFGNIAPWQLIDIKRNPENTDFIELSKDEKICKMIDDGLAYVIIKYWYGQENEDFQHWNSILGLEEPPPRYWSGSDKTYFTYREFLIYLDQHRRSQMVNRNKVPLPFEKDDNDLHMRFVDKSSPVISIGLNVGPKNDELQPLFTNARGYQVYHNDFNSDKNKKELSKSEAATIIQRAYRKHRLKDGAGREVSNKIVMRKKRSKVLSLFTFSKYKHAKLQTNSKDSVLTSSIETLFQRNQEAILIFGGTDHHRDFDVGRNTGNNIIRYIPDRNVWEFSGKLPYPRHHHSVAFYMGKVWLVGGADPIQEQKAGKFVVKTVWSFHPTERTWHNQQPLLEARKNLGLVVYEKHLFAIGGQGKKYDALRSVERYIPDKKQWQRVEPMIKARTGLACAVLGNQILVAGGLSGTHKKIDVLNSIESYDVDQNQWTELKYPLKFPRCFSCLAVVSDKVYIIGGAEKKHEMQKITTSTASMEMWNEETSKWQQVTLLSIPRHGHCIAYLGTQLVIIGGVSTFYGRALSVVECFCMERKTWIRGMANVPIALSGHAVTTLPPFF